MHDTNGKALVPLPPVKMNPLWVNVYPDDRAVYEEIERESRLQLQEFIRRRNADDVRCCSSPGKCWSNRQWPLDSDGMQRPQHAHAPEANSIAQRHDPG